MTSKQRLKELPGAIIKWYKLEKENRIACIVHKHGNSKLIAEALEEEKRNIECISLDMIDSSQGTYNQEGTYNIVIAIDVLEYAHNLPQVLKCFKSLLKPDGKLLLAADNRLGIRYFCGDQDLFTGKSYDSIENYRHLLPWERETMEGKAYSKGELTRFLETAGFTRHRFYSVFPRISNPQILLAEDYEPNEAIDIRVFPEYNNPDTIFLLEEELYPSLMENKLLHPMANGFFIECPLDSEFVPINQVTLSGERGMEYAMATVIRSDGLVEKRVLYPDGRKKLKLLLENHKYLSAHGVRMIDMKLKEDSLFMPYVSGIPATAYFRGLLQEDKHAFLFWLDAFWDLILHSSEQIPFEEIAWEQFETDKKVIKEDFGVILKRGYLDLVSLNCFYLDGEFVFYDQESYMESVPAKAIMLRTIEFIYKFYDQLDEILPRGKLLERYGLIKYRDLYGRLIQSFLNELRHDDELSDYFQCKRREYSTVIQNRERMNYSREDYDRIFKDIFHNIEGRRLYLFGTGKYAQQFCKKYGAAYPIAGYLDNNREQWGRAIEGRLVFAPDMLKDINPNEYKVMVCIKNYMPVVMQLQKMNISNFSVYHPDKV